MNDVILSLTPTGMVPTKAMTQYVPLDPPEIVDDVLACHATGITSVHLHARDIDGTPTYRAEIYGRIIEGIRRAAPEIVICVSLSGRTVRELSRRAEPLTLLGSLKPDMGSLTLSSMNFPAAPSVNEPGVIQGLAEEMLRRGIVPELEIFDLGMVNYAGYLLGKGLLKRPLYANIFLGGIAGAQLDLVHAGLLVRDLPELTYWSFGGLGDAQLGATVLALTMGGGVRVGLEDSIWTDPSRTMLATNLDLVERTHRIAGMLGRKVMKPIDFRILMGMEIAKGRYGR